MKTETLGHIKENFEKVKRGIPYLEKAIKSKSVNKIEKSAHDLIYPLFKIAKNAKQRNTMDAIEELKKLIWWHKLQKEEVQRKYKDPKKIYSVWAKEYDDYPNLIVFLEEKVSSKFIGNVRGKNVLDFGCGTGRYSLPLAKKGANVTAVDFNNAMLKIAKQKAKKAKVKIKFKEADITKYTSDEKFDLIISMLVQDHIKDLKKSVDVINKASKIGTKVVISNIHPDLIYKDYNPKTGKGQGYLIKGYKTDQYYHPLSEYLNLFLKKGFTLTKIQNLYFDKKYQNIKRFKEFTSLDRRAIGIIMKFEKRLKRG